MIHVLVRTADFNPSRTGACLRWSCGGWAAALLAVSTVACGAETQNGGAAAGKGAVEVRGGNSGNGGDTVASQGGANAAAGGAPAQSGSSAGGERSGVGQGGSDGGDDGGDVGVAGPSADCTFEITTSGARIVSYAPEPLGCSALNFGPKTLDTYFVKLDRTQTGVNVPELHEGQIGAGFSAKFSLSVWDIGSWETTPMGCTVEITEQILLGPVEDSLLGDGRQYRISGHGTCSETAKNTDQSLPELGVGDFVFRVRKTWFE